jgi:hemolysin activation/secretion protein
MTACAGAPRRVSAAAAIFAFALLSTGAAFAQAIDPNQVEKKIESRRDELERMKRRDVRVPRIATGEESVSTKPFFLLKRVSIEGAVSLPPDLIEAAYFPYLGRKVSQADLVAIAKSISDLYRKYGFHLSRAIIPPQDLVKGRLRVRVIEGSIREVVVAGDDADRFGVRRFLDPLLHEQPSRLPTLERKLLLVNDLPGVRVADTQLEEIKAATGQFRLIVKLDTWRIFMSQGFDNTGAPATGPWQAYSSTSFNSYLMKGDTFNVSVSSVPNENRELRFGKVAYDMPFGADGIRFGASVSRNDVWPGDARRDINTRTTYDTFDLKGTIVPYQSQLVSFALTGLFTFNEVYERDDLGPTYRDHVRSAALIADFKIKDPFNGWNYWTVGFRQGLNVFGASQPTDDFLSRGIADESFSLLTYSFSRFQTFNDAWSAKVGVTGQLSSTALLDSQRFFLASAAYGPGYYSGDNGVAGAFELRFDQSLNFNYLKGYQLYGFVEAGRVWDYKDPTSGLTLASAGGGIRFYLPGHTQAGFAIAVPLHDSLQSDVRDYRFLFTLSNTLKLCPEQPMMRCS